MAVISIESGLDFEAYSSLAEADEYLAADFGATLWRAETDDDAKNRAIVTAARILNRMEWLGDKTDPDQALAFPRDDMGLDDYDDGETPQEIIDASIILAKLIHAGQKIDDNATIASGIKRQKAGSVEIEYFLPSEDSTRLPTAVHELIWKFLAGSASAIAATIAYGVDDESKFSPEYPRLGPL